MSLENRNKFPSEILNYSHLEWDPFYNKFNNYLHVINIFSTKEGKQLLLSTPITISSLFLLIPFFFYLFLPFQRIHKAISIVYSENQILFLTNNDETSLLTITPRIHQVGYASQVRGGGDCHTNFYLFYLFFYKISNNFVKRYFHYRLPLILISEGKGPCTLLSLCSCQNHAICQCSSFPIFDAINPVSPWFSMHL